MDQVDELLAGLTERDALCDAVKGSEACFLFWDDGETVRFVPYNMTVEHFGWLHASVMGVMQEIMSQEVEDEDLEAE